MTNSKISEVKTTHREPDQERRIFNFKITQFVWVALGILETDDRSAHPAEVDRRQSGQLHCFLHLWLHEPDSVPL